MAEGTETDRQRYFTKAQKLVGEISSLPSMPKAVNHVLGMLKDINTDTAAIAKAIELDIGLAGRVLKMVNSPFYGFSAKIASIGRAVSLLGFAAIKNLAMGVAMDKVFIAEEDEFFHPDAFWRHSLASAAFALVFARHAGYREPEEAFTCGLLHDVGRMIESQFFYNDYTEIVKRSQQSGTTLMEEEAAVLNTTHAFVGAAVLKHWNFPEAIVFLTLLHHDFSPEPPEDIELDLKLRAAVTLADCLAYPLDRTEGIKDKIPEVLHQAQELLEFSQKDVVNITRTTNDYLVSTFKAFGVSETAEGDAKDGG